MLVAVDAIGKERPRQVAAGTVGERERAVGERGRRSQETAQVANIVADDDLYATGCAVRIQVDGIRCALQCGGRGAAGDEAAFRQLVVAIGTSRAKVLVEEVEQKLAAIISGK